PASTALSLPDALPISYKHPERQQPQELPRVKSLKFSVTSLALAGLLVGGAGYVDDAEAARKRIGKPAASMQAKKPARYGSTSAAPARRAAPARQAAPAASAPASSAAPAAQAAPQQAAGSGFMGSMAGAVAGSVIGGAVANALFADEAVAEEGPAAEALPEQDEELAQ